MTKNELWNEIRSMVFVFLAAPGYLWIVLIARLCGGKLEEIDEE